LLHYSPNSTLHSSPGLLETLWWEAVSEIVAENILISQNYSPLHTPQPGKRDKTLWRGAVWPGTLPPWRSKAANENAVFGCDQKSVLVSKS